MPRIGRMDYEVVVVGIKYNCEPILEALRAKDPLEGHLEGRIGHERNARLPRNFREVVQRKSYMFKLDRSRASEDLDRARFCAGVPESDPDCFTCATIKKGYRRPGVHEGPKTPITVRTKLEPNIQSRS